jgi:predicted enzyme related to lactoylglutathione lyase
LLTHPVYGISHVDVPVHDIPHATEFYTAALGTSVSGRRDGAVDVELAGFTLRLVSLPRTSPRVTLRIMCGDVAAAAEGMRSLGARILYPPSRVDDRELACAVEDPFGNTLVAWRNLSEDEYTSPPALPKEHSWDPDAEALLTSLLSRVPALFRGLARGRATRLAEELAKSTRFVTRNHAIRGYILSSSKITRGRTRQPLIDHGIDPAAFAADFDAD